MTHYKKRIGLTVSMPLYQKILNTAEYQGKTINSTCLDIFWEYFEQRNRTVSHNSADIKDKKTI